MSEPSLAHDYLEWTKQQLTAIQTTLVTLEGSLGSLKNEARTHAEQAIARLRTAQDEFKTRIEAARTEAVAANKAIAETTVAASEAAWSKVESAYQDFLKAAAENTTVVQTAITARTEAQRQVWQSSLQAVRASAAGAIDHARVEADAALKLLSAETEKAGKLLSAEAEKAGTTLGHVSSAGEESWKLIKAGLDETVSAFERTWKKVYESVSNIR